MRSTHLQPWQSLILLAASALGAACGDSADTGAPTATVGAPSAPDATLSPPASTNPARINPSTGNPSTGNPSTGNPSTGNPAAGSSDPTDTPAATGGEEGVDSNIGLEPGDGEVATSSPTTATADAGTSEPPPPPEADPDPPATGPLTVYLAGDSIVQTYADTPSDSDQAGWGQMLGEFFDERVTIENRAIGGRTARRFIDEGRLDEIVAELEPGNFLLVQFGTNDGNRTATYTIGAETIPYFLDPATDFKAYLQRYVDAARSRDANPVFVTPTPRNSAYCVGGNGTGAHAAAMRELGQADGVPVVDLNASTVAFLTAICPAPIPESFFLLRADGTVDGTHFQERGARILAGFVADGLSVPGLPFGAYRRAEP